MFTSCYHTSVNDKIASCNYHDNSPVVCVCMLCNLIISFKNELIYCYCVIIEL